MIAILQGAGIGLCGWIVLWQVQKELERIAFRAALRIEGLKRGLSVLDDDELDAVRLAITREGQELRKAQAAEFEAHQRRVIAASAEELRAAGMHVSPDDEAEAVRRAIAGRVTP